MALEILGFPKELDQIVCCYVSHDISFWFSSVITRLGINGQICDFYNSGKIAAGVPSSLTFKNGSWRFDNKPNTSFLSSFDKNNIDWASVYSNARSEEDFQFIDTFNTTVEFLHVPTNTKTPSWFFDKHRIGRCIELESLLTLEFLRQNPNKDAFNWASVCANQHLTNEMLEEILKLIYQDNWRQLSTNISLPLSFFQKHLNKCYSKELTSNRAVPLSFVESHLLQNTDNQYSWQRRSDLTTEFLNQHARPDPKSDELLSQNQNLPIDFIRKNTDRLQYAVSEDISNTSNGSCFLREELFQDNVDYIHLEAILGWSSEFSVELFDEWIDLKIGKEVDYELDQGEIFYASQYVTSEKFLNQFADQLNWEVIFNRTNVPVSVLLLNLDHFPQKSLTVHMVENLIKVMEAERVPLVKKILLF